MYDPDSLSALLESKKLPPVENWRPERCGEIDIRIARDGSWYFNDSIISRLRLVKLFSTILRRESNDYFLVTPVEKLRIQVEDVPFIAVEMEIKNPGTSQVLLFRTNLDDVVIADKMHQLWMEEISGSERPYPYIHIRSNLNALIARSVFYELADMAIQNISSNQQRLGVWSAGQFFELGSIHS